MTGWCNTTVGFIDNEIVGPNPGIDDLTSVPFPCYNVRHGRRSVGDGGGRVPPTFQGGGTA